MFVKVAFGHGTPSFPEDSLLNMQVSRPGIEPDLRASRARVRIRHTPRTCSLSAPRQGVEPHLAVPKTAVRPSHSQGMLSSSPSRNRTWSNSFGSCHAIQHTDEPKRQHPDLESNQDQDLRRVLCCPLHHRDTRADDWIRTSINRFTRPAPFSVEPRRQSKQECKESNPAWRFWRPLASQKHTPVVNVVQG